MSVPVCLTRWTGSVSLLAVVALASAVPGSLAAEPLVWEEATALDQATRKHEDDLEGAKNEAGKSFQRVRRSEYYLPRDDGTVPVYFTVRQNLEDKGIFELHEVLFKKSGKEWTVAGSEVIDSFEPLRRRYVEDKPVEAQGFSLEHGDYSVSVGAAKVWPAYWNGRLSGFIIDGQGQMKYKPADIDQQIYLKLKVRAEDEGKNITEVDTQIDVVQIGFHPDAAEEWIARLDADVPLNEADYEGTGSDKPVIDGFAGISTKGDREYSSSEYSVTPFEDEPGQFLVRTHLKEWGWVAYHVRPQDTIPVKLGWERRRGGFVGSVSGRTYQILCHSQLPKSGSTCTIALDTPGNTKHMFQLIG